MEYKVTEIKEGIKLHTIKTDKFKTNIVSVLLTDELSKENVTKNAMISAILRRGSANMPSQEEISRNLEEMYGASFNSGIDKIGDNQVLKFYIESINDDFLPQSDEKMWKVSLEKILEIVFNPLIENNEFKKEYVEQEKNTLKQLIESRKDSKARYALERCIEEMYKDEPYGLFKYGNIEDLNDIDGKNLYDYYRKLISKCKIDIFISGKIGDVEGFVNDNVDIKKLETRNPKYNDIVISEVVKKEENIVTESMDVSQGKLELGLNVNINSEDDKYKVMIYNSLLGGSANSKMFQNVREKEHLAYVASSNYMKHKNAIFINTGIEIDNYEKALNLIKEQINQMRNGEFEEQDIENAKIGIESAIKTIADEQDTQITYYFGQELTNRNVSLDEYIEKIKKVSKEDVLEIANNVSINTIYFLRN